MAMKDNPKLIVVATDGSPPADKALDYAVAHAKLVGARLRVVTVLEYQVYGMGAGALGPQVAAVYPQADEAATAVVTSAAARARRAGIECDEVLLRAHEASSAIVRDAEAAGADLIIVGSHGRTGLSRMLLGSVAERVVRLAASPVLVVR
jgi:nucleotide-binding universal stress UspA family protein